MTAFGGEPQDLDDIDKPPEGEPEAGPIKAWSAPGSASMYQHGMQSVQLKTVGRTHKAACMKFYGSDPITPSHARLEITQHRKVLGMFDFDNPEIKFYLEDNEIQVLKAFLAGQFLPADGYYVRVDSKEMAAEVAKLSAENLGGVLAAISDKTHLIEAIQASGHADFLADSRAAIASVDETRHTRIRSRSQVSRTFTQSGHPADPLYPNGVCHRGCCRVAETRSLVAGM